MKKLLTILALMALTTPTLAKTSCSAAPIKNATSHYRLVDGKKCWYRGVNLAKPNLEWKHDDVLSRVVTRNSGSNRSTSISPSFGRGTGELDGRSVKEKSNVQSTQPPKRSQAAGTTLPPPVLLDSAGADSSGVSGAIKALCGAEDWGFCASFETRWKGAFNVK